MTRPQTDPLDSLFGGGFIVLTRNRSEPPDTRCEAWAYNGPLDFDQASPLCFGLGADPEEAIAALRYHLPDVLRKRRN
ncbi:MAG: hypothetical protein AAGH88_08915 [Planctomycetota bacterium]